MAPEREQRPQERKNSELPQNPPALAEVNLMKHPFFLLSKKDGKRLLKKALQEGPQIGCCLVEADGRIRVWEVHPNVKWGYPGPLDKKVFTAVQKLATERGWPPPNPFPLGSLRGLCRLVGKSGSGRDIAELKASLERIGVTAIRTDAFYLKEEGRYWKEEEGGGTFTLWSVFWRGEELPDGRRAEGVYLWFHPPFYWSLLAYYVKPVDFDYYMGLPPLAQRIYELVGLKFFGRRDSPYVRFEYEEYCRLLPITPQRHLSLARRVLDRAHRVLEGTGFLAEVRWEGPREGPWSLLYFPGPRAEEEVARAQERLRRFQELTQSREETLGREAEIQALVETILSVTEDPHSEGFYRKLARRAQAEPRLQDLVFRCLSEVKAEWHEGLIRASKGAAFTDKLKRYCKECGIDLPLGSGTGTSSTSKGKSKPKPKPRPKS